MTTKEDIKHARAVTNEALDNMAAPVVKPIKIKVCAEDHLKPARMTDGAAGWDVKAAHAHEIAPGEIVKIATGVRIAPPPHQFAFLCIRSSLAANGLSLLNGVGVIDSDYRGEIRLPVINLGRETVSIARGDRVGQLIFAHMADPRKVEMIDRRTFDAETTQRGEGGFGSTGVA